MWGAGGVEPAWRDHVRHSHRYSARRPSAITGTGVCVRKTLRKKRLGFEDE